MQSSEDPVCGNWHKDAGAFPWGTDEVCCTRHPPFFLYTESVAIGAAADCTLDKDLRPARQQWSG
jgi:hypothetical protein